MSRCADHRPIEILEHEHQVILRVLDVLETLMQRSEAQNGTFELKPLSKCVEFFELFADACHHAKEEDLLFPVLESRGIPNEGGPIGVMLEEHRIARSYVQRMNRALERFGEPDDPNAGSAFRTAATSYLDLLRQHILKENNILFMIGDQAMTDEDREHLDAEFCKIGCRSFGGKHREELEQIAGELEAMWGRAS